MSETRLVYVLLNGVNAAAESEGREESLGRLNLKGRLVYIKFCGSVRLSRSSLRTFGSLAVPTLAR